jgi:hypothetical protein
MVYEWGIRWSLVVVRWSFVADNKRLYAFEWHIANRYADCPAPKHNGRRSFFPLWPTLRGATTA